MLGLAKVWPRSCLDFIRRDHRTAKATVFLLALGLLVLPLSAAAQQTPPDRLGTYTIENVTVIPMDGDGERHLVDHTVVVEQGRITAVGRQDSVEVPAEAEVIDGRGRFLIPGLVDMRVRLPAPADPMRVLVVDEFLFLFLANGITTVRTIDGAPYQLDLRDEVASGEVSAPQLFVGSPLLEEDSGNGSEASDIRAYVDAGYDFLTIGSELSEEAWRRVSDAAGIEGIPLGGRIPMDVGTAEAIVGGLSTVDRLEALLGDTRREDLPADPAPEEVFRATDEEKLRAIARQLTEAGVYVVPAQYLSNHLAGWNHLFGTVANGDSIVALEEYRYVSMGQKDEWVTDSWNRVSGAGVTHESAEAFAEWRRTLVSALHAAGVQLLVGTDSPALFNVPAFSLYRELDLMEEAGMTPYEVLVAGTRNAAKYASEVLGGKGDFGTIVEGNRADLILLEQDPLESLVALQDRVGIMAGGRWLPETELEVSLAEIAERYEEFETD